MPNKDGFEPGQAVTLADIMRAEKARKAPVALPTREDIAAMKKADVIEWLEAHGVEAPTGSVADLRNKLTSIMYVEA